jgi:hypothetical protein
MTWRIALLTALLVFLAAQWCQAQTVPREELQRRIAFANKHYATRSTPGSQTDRGKAYIVLGPPDQIRDVEPKPNSEGLPWEEWTYHTIPGIGTNVCLGFADIEMDSSYKMTPTPCEGDADDVGAKRRYDLIQKRIKQALATPNRPRKNAP